MLGYLAGALLNYKEEGLDLSPSIILCDDLVSLLHSFPGAISYTIGFAALDSSSGPKILKDCGPLSSSNWFIFLKRVENNRVRYGVFTYFKLPTAIPLHEAIAINSSIFCILIRKISTNAIEFRGSKGNTLVFVFSTTRGSIETNGPIEKFANACCERLRGQTLHANFRLYLGRLLESALTSSHGTILLCSDKEDLTLVPELADAIR